MTTRRTTGVLGLAAFLCVGFAVGASAAEAAGGKTTLENLQAAYDGESNAKARYEAFAAKADEEGYKSVAALFKAAAASEGIHAKKHAAAIKKLNSEPKASVGKPEVKSTQENLQAAVKGESGERDSMYPAFIKQAEADKDAMATKSFKAALNAETAHAKFFQEALDNLDGWKAPGKTILVCEVCGFTTMDAAVEKCPICAAPKSKFEIFK